jgi:hypothetical protein
MKKLILALLVAVLLTTLVSSAAFAAPPVGKGAQQVALYPCGPGNSDDVLTGSPAQGKVILNAPDGNVTLIINGIVKGLTPSTEYRVFVREIAAYTGESIWASGVWRELIAFTTEADGTGSFHLNIRAADLPAGGYNIQVAINPAAEELTHTVLATEKFTAVTVGQ